MPWKVAKSSKCPKSKPWAVLRSDTGKKVACHPSEAKAKEHMKALYANETQARMRWTGWYG